MTPTLVLASSSPRRQDLLRLIGLDFVVRPADIDETQHPNEEPRVYVERLASEKATARVEPKELVLGADTVVVIEGEVLGKPRTPEMAAQMLRRLSGREHLVLSGVALVDGSTEKTVSAVAATRVSFSEIDSRDIDWYINTGEPLDKAGAYAVQGVGSLLVEEIHGTQSNVTGLPVPTTALLFRKLGYRIQQFSSRCPTTA